MARGGNCVDSSTASQSAAAWPLTKIVKLPPLGPDPTAPVKTKVTLWPEISAGSGALFHCISATPFFWRTPNICESPRCVPQAP